MEHLQDDADAVAINSELATANVENSTEGRNDKNNDAECGGQNEGEEEEDYEEDEEEQEEEELSLVDVIREGDVELALQLLEAGLDPNLQNEQGQSALHVAAQCGLTPLVQVLLCNGAAPDITDRTGYTPLQLAVFRRHADCARCLLEAGADANAPRPNGERPLHAATRNNHAVLVHQLLSFGADASTPSRAGDTVLHVAVEHASPEVVRALIEAGAPTASQTEAGDTPLHVLATALARNRNSGNVEARMAILQHLADVGGPVEAGIRNARKLTALDILAEEYLRTVCGDMQYAVVKLLEIKPKLAPETQDTLFYGMERRTRTHGCQALAALLPLMRPESLRVHSVKPMMIQMAGGTELSFRKPIRRLQRFRGNVDTVGQFARASRILCELGCRAPTLHEIVDLGDEDGDDEDYGLTSKERESVRETIALWKMYAGKPAELQIQARTSVRRAVRDLRVETFDALPLPPRLRYYTALAELNKIEY